MSFSSDSVREEPPSNGTEPSSSLVRRGLVGCVRLAARTVGSLCVLGLLGHFVRGRSIPLEILLYFPLALLGSMASVLGLALIRLVDRRDGSLVMSVGLVSIMVSATWMTGHGPALHPNPSRPGESVRLLHWNVLWGGFDAWRGGWGSIVDEVGLRSPDIVVLSEAPSDPLLRQLRERLGPTWQSATIGSPPPHTGYRYQFAFLSRWPIRIVAKPWVPNGTAIEAIVDHPTQPIRILAVDGKSPPGNPRSPMLSEVTSIVEKSASSDRGPIDLVVGDFNCVGRTRGFDDLRAASPGYKLASESASGWRATWPTWLPVYDIDHIWVRSTHAIWSCAFFSRNASDHRGQITEICLGGS